MVARYAISGPLGNEKNSRVTNDAGMLAYSISRLSEFLLVTRLPFVIEFPLPAARDLSIEIGPL